MNGISSPQPGTLQGANALDDAQTPSAKIDISAVAIAALELHLILPFQLVNGNSHEGEWTDNTASEFRQYVDQQGIWKAANPLATSDAFRTANYLHPFIRRFWFDKDLIRRWQRDDVREIAVSVVCGDTPEEVRYAVTSTTLLQIEPNIALLHLSLMHSSTSPPSTTPLNWNSMLRQLNAIRRLYPPYLGATGHGHFPCQVVMYGDQGVVLSTWSDGKFAVDKPAMAEGNYVNAAAADSANYEQPLAPHFAYLLAPIHCETAIKPSNHSIPAQAASNWRYHHLGDERATLVTRIQVATTQELVKIDRGNWMRLCFADPPANDTLPYSASFMRQFEVDHCYDRWWYTPSESGDAPSRILNCGYAFHWVGSAEDKAFFADEEFGAPKTFTSCYLPLALIAAAQKASLLVHADHLTRFGMALRGPDTRQPAPTNPPQHGSKTEHRRQEIANLYRSFIEFTQSLWHDEISPQTQGQELFDMWRKHLRMQPLYDEIRCELKDTKDWLDQETGAEEVQRAAALNKQVKDLTKLAAGFAMPALFVAVLSLWGAIGDLSESWGTGVEFFGKPIFFKGGGSAPPWISFVTPRTGLLVASGFATVVAVVFAVHFWKRAYVSNEKARPK